MASEVQVNNRSTTQVFCGHKGRHLILAHFSLVDAMRHWQSLRETPEGYALDRLVVWEHITPDLGQHWHVGHVKKGCEQTATWMMARRRKELQDESHVTL